MYCVFSCLLENNEKGNRKYFSQGRVFNQSLIKWRNDRREINQLPPTGVHRVRSRWSGPKRVVQTVGTVHPLESNTPNMYSIKPL
jgi:hypothetical protein